jgi:hypothetical protein
LVSGQEKIDINAESTIVRVNDVLFQDINSKVFYYNLYHNCSDKSKDTIILRSISYGENNAFTKVDLNSFRDMGLYWVDDNYIYYIYRWSETQSVRASEIDKKEEIYLYKNSYYRVVDGKLDYFINYQVEGDTVIDCTRDNNELIDVNEFHILDWNRKRKDECYINAFAVYKNRFLFHGCWVDLERIGSLGEELIKLNNEKIYLKPLIIDHKKRIDRK